VRRNSDARERERRVSFEGAWSAGFFVNDPFDGVP
jgi:hypothetical protein